MDSLRTGLIIAEARREKGLTQKQLAERLHISDRTVSKWERGKGFPDPGLLEPLADALQLPLGDIIRGERTAPSWNEDSSIREILRILQGAWRKRILRLLRRAALAAAALILAESVLFYIRTGGDGMRRWQLVEMFRENYALSCSQFPQRGVYRVEWISGDSRIVVTDPAALDEILLALKALEVGDEYRDWGPGSVQGYLLVAAEDAGTADASFILSFPAFRITASIGGTEGRSFCYEASICGVEAHQALDALIGGLVRDGLAVRYALGVP